VIERKKTNKELWTWLTNLRMNECTNERIKRIISEYIAMIIKIDYGENNTAYIIMKTLKLNK
jgi:hypothetical protein